MRHIAIVGAGVTGVTTAYALVERGYEVTVFDRNRYAGMETSFANGGQLSASNAEVWNSASTVLKGLRWMMRRDAPLLVNPLPGWHKYSWMAEFIANISNYRANTIETVRLAIAARKYLFEMAEREKIDFDLEKRGILHFYRDRAGFDKALKVNDLLAKGGLDRRAVTVDEIRRIEPALKGTCYAGFFTPSDSTGDIHKFTRGLADVCARRGVRFCFDASIDKIVPSVDGTFQIGWLSTASREGGSDTQWQSLQADAVVICAGTASRDFASMLGDRLNIYPVKGYSITVGLHTPESQTAAPQVSILDDATKIVTSRLGRDRFRVAGTAEFNGFNRDIRHDRVEPLVRWTREHFPAVATDKVVAWSGLRPMMPSMLPRVGAGRRPGVFYNTGHGHLGWTLSAATAQTLADAVSATVAIEGRNRAA
ncbi:D-amino acid dehydrogenase [Bradyrhizobium lablabi]|uniref:D-amino acid dehydrogenase n=1 Tax=Bradyrhizobium lablabi TaxID=722472 RepID=UPI001BADA3AB|nr:D-amino acid dehydrogenase [Bradyrhizobium lablabi]MBR1125931.1 D-amino acid dehydrogenase [Bradyrhizobium lablabi]